jgi:hypothetical protein
VIALTLTALPTLVYLDIKYDGGLFCYLLCDENPHMEEKYPTGTQIEQVDSSTNMLLSGMVMDIPFPGTSADSPPCGLSYTVLFNNGSTASIPLQNMALLIPPPPVNPSSVGDSSSSQDSLLLHFLCINSKITYKHEGQYHKGYLMKHNSSYRFCLQVTRQQNKGRLGRQFTQSGHELSQSLHQRRSYSRSRLTHVSSLPFFVRYHNL